MTMVPVATYKLGAEGKWIASFRDEEQARSFAWAEAERLDTWVTVIKRRWFRWTFCCAYPSAQEDQIRAAWETGQELVRGFEGGL